MKRPPKNCLKPGCANLVEGNGWHCEQHRPPRKQYADTNRPNATQRGYTSPQWRRLRKLVLARDAQLCQLCGKPAGASAHVDHIIPKSQGGRDTLENLQTLCPGCHTLKTNHDRRQAEQARA